MKIVISIIIFRSPLETLYKNLKMFLKQDFLLNPKNQIEIFILDNDQGKQIVEVKNFIESNNIKNIHYIENENVGFGAGQNKIFYLAKQKFSFDYFLAANPDGIPHYTLLSELVNFAKSNNNQGIFEAIQFPLEHPKIYNKETFETLWCSGCCCLYPYEVFEKLQGFDERFFMYMDDVDLSWRVRANNYKCYAIDKAWFSHSVDNEGRNTIKQEIMMFKSAYKLAKKYQNESFAKNALKHLKKLITKDDLENFLQEANTLEFLKDTKYLKIADFNHNLHFSEARW